MMRRLWQNLRAPGRGIWVQAGLLALLGVLARVFRVLDPPWRGAVGRRVAELTQGLRKRLYFEDECYIPFWWSLVIVAGIIGALFLLSPLWLRWSAKPIEATRIKKPRAARSAVIFLVCGLALALALRVPRLGRTIERDEQDTLRRNILGFVFLEQDGTIQHFELPLMAAFWEDGQANNPFLFSVLSRFTQRAWQSLAGAEPWRVNLPLLRMWALVPGVLSLAAIWWWLRLLEKPRAASLALILGAVHPMHVDYSVQARGYAFVMLFTALALCAGWLALTQGKWRHWLSLAACFFGCLYSAPISLYFAATLGLSVLFILLARWFAGRSREARADLVRFTVASTAAAVVFLPLVLPAVESAMNYVNTSLRGESTGRSGLDAPWPLSSWSKYMSGALRPDIAESDSWDNDGINSAQYLFTRMLPRDPVLFALVWIIMPSLAALGARSLWRRRAARPLVMAGLSAPFVAWGIHYVADTFLYYWYLIFFLPPVIAHAATGLDEACSRFHRRIPRAILTACFFMIFLGPNVIGRNRFGWFPPRASAPETFNRGRFLWVTYPDGMTQREPNPDATPRSEKP